MTTFNDFPARPELGEDVTVAAEINKTLRTALTNSRLVAYDPVTGKTDAETDYTNAKQGILVDGRGILWDAILFDAVETTNRTLLTEIVDPNNPDARPQAYKITENEVYGRNNNTGEWMLLENGPDENLLRDLSGSTQRI